MGVNDLLSRLAMTKPDVTAVTNVQPSDIKAFGCNGSESANVTDVTHRIDCPDVVTAVTGSNGIDVTPKSPWIEACTAVTAVTSLITKALHDAVTAEPIADMPGNLLASFQADSAVDRNTSVLPTVADSDDRRLCTQCLNLRGRVCSIAGPSKLVSARQGYQPMRDTLHRCAGYLPNANDNDQRPGRERWPGLTDTKGTK